MPKSTAKALKAARKQRAMTDCAYIAYSATMPDGMVWVGVSKDNLKYTRQKRESNSRGKHKSPLYDALRKHGIENVKWKIQKKCRTRLEARQKVLDLRKSLTLKEKLLNNNKEIAKKLHNQIDGKPYGVVYKITLTNNKYYIGTTTRPVADRLDEHISRAKSGNDKVANNPFYNELRALSFQIKSVKTLSEHQSEKELTDAEEKDIAEAMKKEPRRCLNGNSGKTIGYHRKEQLQKDEGEEKVIQPLDKFWFRSSKMSGLAENCPRREISTLHLYELKEAGYKLNQESYGVAAIAGTILHEAAVIPAKNREKWIHGKNNGFEQLYLKLCQEAAKNGSEVEFDLPTPDVNALRLQVEGMAAAIDEATDGFFWKYPEQFLVEEHNKFQVQEDLDEKYHKKEINITGRFDLFHIQSGQIYDIKTTVKPEPNNHGYQLATYYMLLKKAGYHPSHEAVIVHLTRHKYKTVDPVNQKPCRLFRFDLRPFLKELPKVIERAVDNAITFRNRGGAPNPHALSFITNHWSCSPKYCRLHGTSACTATSQGAYREYFINPTKETNNDK